MRKYFPIILLVLMVLALISGIYRKTKEKETKSNILPKNEVIVTVLPYSTTIDFVVTKDTVSGVVKSYDLRDNKLTLKNIIHAKNN